MDKQVTYTLAIDIPINPETSRLYSSTDEVLFMAVNQAMNLINIVIEREGFISMERIFRILEAREHVECPHILFTHLSDWSFSDTNLLSLFLEHDFELYPVLAKRTQKKKKRIIETRPRRPEPKEEPEDIDEGEYEDWEPKTSTQTETSESEEKEKT